MNMNLETTEDLAEVIADWLGIYGCCKQWDEEAEEEHKCTFTKEKPFCCRMGFVEEISQRMRDAVKNEKIFENIE
jgi:hypothetical protein